MYGKAAAYETDGPGLGVTCSFYRGTNALTIFPDAATTSVVSTITALVSSAYNDADKTSRLSITAAID
jgi:hypothetical protein